MKVAILAGGLGSRLLEETRVKSKAMVQIGGRPILWHLLRYYQTFGHDEFVVALGYQAASIRNWFGEDAAWRQELEDGVRQRWTDLEITVDLVDTGPETENGGRVGRLRPYLGNGTFMLTWCDGLADVDLSALRAFHRAHGRLATLTAARPPARFGRLKLEGDRVRAFDEKTLFDHEWINGAFFVLEPEVLDLIPNDGVRFEHDVLRRLADDGELMAYRHDGFWQCMDTLKEAQDLDRLWRSGEAPWRIWS